MCIRTYINENTSFSEIEANKLCGRPPQYAPAPCKLTLTFWPWKWCPVRVTCDFGYFCVDFSLPRPLCSRLRPDVRCMYDVWQTSDAHHRLMPSTLGAGHNKEIKQLIETWNWPPNVESFQPKRCWLVLPSVNESHDYRCGSRLGPGGAPSFFPSPSPLCQWYR